MRKTKTKRTLYFLSVYIALTIITIVLIRLYSEYSSHGHGEFHIAGAIRAETPGNWQLIVDDVHKPINIESIAVHKGAISVKFSEPVKHIHSFSVTSDETFASLGLTAGASVNKDRAIIELYTYSNGRYVQIDASKVESKWGNFWIFGTFSL